MAKTVLIFDDDLAILTVTETILSMAGYNVFTSRICDNALDCVKLHQPDIILMDLWIPNIGGEKATNILKADPATKHIPVVLFSANNDIEKIAGKTKADAFIKKPYDIEELEKLVSEIIRNNENVSST
jgi:CheY-like chemotaxis protein